VRVGQIRRLGRLYGPAPAPPAAAWVSGLTPQTLAARKTHSCKNALLRALHAPPASCLVPCVCVCLCVRDPWRAYARACVWVFGVYCACAVLSRVLPVRLLTARRGFAVSRVAAAVPLSPRSPVNADMLPSLARLVAIQLVSASVPLHGTLVTPAPPPRACCWPPCACCTPVAPCR